MCCDSESAVSVWDPTCFPIVLNTRGTVYYQDPYYDQFEFRSVTAGFKSVTKP